jgi:hypothetical protein
MAAETDADVVLPEGALRLGKEIARGASGVVHDATLYGGTVCAKVSPWRSFATLPQRWGDFNCPRCVFVSQSLHMLCNPEVYELRRGTPLFHDMATQLLREARLLQSLRHPNVVQMHGVVMHPEHGHMQWLVTEQANGGSLEAWLSVRGVLSLEELLDLLRSVMGALVYLHNRVPAVLHRDVKPANVLVFMTFGGGIVWKLGDVGIATVLQSTLHARTLTGTLMYMAPDVLLGPYDGKVDVFSVGIMAAELVVRHMDIADFHRSATSQYRLPSDRPALVADACDRLEHVSAALASLVRSCSAMMAADRMNSEDALRALQAIVLQVGAVGAGAVVGAAAAAAAAAAVVAGATTGAVAAAGAGAGVGAIGAGAVSGRLVPQLTVEAAHGSLARAVQVVDMSEALEAMEELRVPSDVSERVCDAMAVAAAASDSGEVTAEQFLRMVVEHGVKTLVAAKLRRRLRTTAPVPPPTVRTRESVGLRCVLVVCTCYVGYSTALTRCGVLWCLVVSCGVVWCRVVSCGVVWYRVVSCGVVWCRVVSCGAVRCGMVRWWMALVWVHTRHL